MDAAKGIEQYLILAKGLHREALVQMTKQALDDPNVYFYGELLALPNVQDDLKNVSEDGKKYWNALQLFSYETYQAYVKDVESFPALTERQVDKLRQLTIATLASKLKQIPYKVLLQELGLSNKRQLEDLIIEAMYANIIAGKLDQKNEVLEIDAAMGRDVKPTDLAGMVNVLTQWCERCQEILLSVDNQMTRANVEKCRVSMNKAEVEQELQNLKKTIKTSTGAADMEENQPMDVSSTMAAPPVPADDKKKEKRRIGLRSSGAKFWKT